MKHLLFSLFFFAGSFLQAAERRLKDDFDMMPLVSLRDDGGALLPVRVDGTASHLLLSTDFNGIVLNPEFSEQAKLKTYPYSRRIPTEMHLKDAAKAEGTRVDMLEVGTTLIVERFRGRQCLVGSHDAPAGARVRGRIYRCAGSAGLDLISDLGLTLDFDSNLILIPKRGVTPGTYAFHGEKENRLPVLMTRDRRSGAYYLVMRVKRKEMAFLVDLRATHNSVSPFIAKQLNLDFDRDADKPSVRFPELSLGQEPIEGDTFVVEEVDFAGRRANTHRVAGVVGINFLKKHGLAIDFSGPVALTSAPD